MDISEFINRYSISAIVNNIEVLYNVTNDIYIPFEKTELIKHVHRTYKKAEIYIDISYKVDGIVGAGIIVEKKNEKE